MIKPWKNARHGRSSKSYIGRLVARTLLSSLTLRQQKYLMPDSAAEFSTGLGASFAGEIRLWLLTTDL